MQFRPRFYQSLLSPGHLSRDQFDRCDSEYPDVVLIVGVKVRSVMRLTDLCKHSDDDAEETTQFRHQSILAVIRATSSSSSTPLAPVDTNLSAYLC